VGIGMRLVEYQKKKIVSKNNARKVSHPVGTDSYIST
jgi:hypothetical protein